MNLSTETMIALAGYVLQLGIVMGVMRNSAEATKEQLKLLRNDMDMRISEIRDDLQAHRTRVHELGNMAHQQSMEMIKTLAALVKDQK